METQSTFLDSLETLLVVIILIGLITLTGSHWYFRVACYFVVIGNSGRQLDRLIGGYSFTDELKVSRGSPVLKLAVLAAVDFVSLALAATVLVYTGSAAPFRWHMVWVEGRRIVSLRHTSALWGLHPMELLIGIATLCLYASLLNPLTTPWQLKRTRGDRVRIAEKYFSAGDLDAGNRWLAPVLADTTQRDSATLSAQGISAILRRDLPLALSYATVMAGLRNVTRATADADDALWILTVWARPLRRVPEVATQVWQFVINEGIGDPALAAILPLIPITDGLNTISAVATLKDPPYTLTHAAMILRDGQFRAALEILQLVPKDPYERWLVAELLKMDATATIELTAGSSKPTIDSAVYGCYLDLLSTIETTRELELAPLWLRQFVSDQYAGIEMLAKLARDRPGRRAVRSFRVALVGANADRDLGSLIGRAGLR
jgi:hypothetical protein